MPKHNVTKDDHGRYWFTFAKPSPEGWPRRVQVHPRECPYCKETFYVSRSRNPAHCGRSCASKCRNSKQGCDHSPSAKPNREIQSGERHHGWKGGKLKRKGYVLIHKPDHPSLQGTQRKYVLEHRLIMEEHLGRLLESNETVHHKNGIRDDNRIKNLELWESSHPYGQRKEEIKHCKSCTCNEIS